MERKFQFFPGSLMFYIGSERKCCMCDSSGFWLRNGQRNCREQKSRFHISLTKIVKLINSCICHKWELGLC